MTAVMFDVCGCVGVFCLICFLFSAGVYDEKVRFPSVFSKLATE